MIHYKNQSAILLGRLLKNTALIVCLFGATSCANPTTDGKKSTISSDLKEEISQIDDSHIETTMLISPKKSTSGRSVSGIGGRW